MMQLREGATQVPPRVAYLAGPMTDQPNFNHAEFARYARILRDEADWVVYSPPELIGGYTGMPHDWYMRVELAVVKECTHLFLMPGWEKSSGCARELVAATTYGLTIGYLDDDGFVFDSFALANL